MPDPFYPTVDPNSDLGRRLAERELRLGTPQGRAGALPDVGGMDTESPQFQALLRAQVGPAAAAPALPPAPAAPAPAPAAAAGPNPFRDGTGQASPTPADLAAGNTALAPVPTLDPFRVLPARQSGDRTLADGTILPGDFFGPGMAGMTNDGFQPGLQQIGGMTTSASSPAEFLMGLQRQAQINGVSPNLTMESLLGGMNNSADRSGRAAVAAQAGTVNLATGRMSADAQQNAARTAAEASARAAAFSAIPGLAQGAATMPAALVQSLGDIIDRAVQPGGGGGYGGPMGPGGPAPGPGGTSAPGGAPGAAPGAPRPGGPGAALAAAAAGGDFLRPLQATFGTRNAQTGVVQRPENFNPDAAARTFLDRFATGTPEQRQQAVLAIERGDLGDPTQVLESIARRGAVARLRGQGGVTPGRSGLTNLLRTSGLFRGLTGGDATNAPRPHAVMGPDGRPVMEFRGNPNQNAAAHAFGALMSGGVGYNQAVIPGFNPIDFSQTDVNGPIVGAGRATGTPEVDQRHGLTAMDVIRMTQRYRTATGGR
jgi:hypothetical protein